MAGTRGWHPAITEVHMDMLFSRAYFNILTYGPIDPRSRRINNGRLGQEASRHSTSIFILIPKDRQRRLMEKHFVYFRI